MIPINNVIASCILFGIVISGIHSQSACSGSKWQCKNRDCIRRSRLCNGQKDCSDGSDEIAEACIQFSCPSFGFRCAYGACVTAQAECNGVQDCADNSDEITPKCLPTNIVQQRGSCGLREFQCTSSDQCIPMKNLCDGRKHCDDGSDEIVENCAAMPCPGYAFRCGYGACIPGPKKCDGERDCADGSDEFDLLCETNSATSMLSNNGGRCEVPSWPNTVVSYASNDRDIIQPGQFVDPFALININCKDGFARFGEQENVCVNGKWGTQPIPVCERLCEQFREGITYSVQCFYNNVAMNCNEPLRPGTQAKFSCNAEYMKPPTTIDTAVCQDNGNWDYQPYGCIPVCGNARTRVQTFIVGDIINNTYVPWHAVIYKQNRDEYKNICGGTIVSTRIVISAAHCFWNAEKKRAYKKNKFLVAAGKYYRQYEAKEAMPIQTFPLAKLEISTLYRDLDGNYEADIAILVLQSHIIYQFHIKPICIDTDLKENERTLPPGTTGTTVGFGIMDSENRLSDVLRVAQQEVDNWSQCNANSGSIFTTTTITTGDKICVRASETDAVCAGDSGGGFIVSKPENNVLTYYLWGIVSHSVSGPGICNANSHVAFTNVQTYIRLIDDYMIRYREI